MAKNDTEKVQADSQEELQNIIPEELKPIEKLKEELNLPNSIFEAIKLSQRWAEGKEVTKAEFEAAISKWLGSPIDKGRSVK